MVRKRPPTKRDLWEQFRTHIESRQQKIEPEAPVMEIDLLRDKFNNRDQKNADVLYEPTATSNPGDPRTHAARYWRDERVLQIEWGDGGVAYNYYQVSPEEWRRFVRVKSPGRFVNRVLNAKPYGKA